MEPSGNPKDSVWEDWGTLGKISGNHHHPSLKNPISMSTSRYFLMVAIWNLPRPRVDVRRFLKVRKLLIRRSVVFRGVWREG